MQCDHVDSRFVYVSTESRNRSCSTEWSTWERQFAPGEHRPFPLSLAPHCVSRRLISTPACRQLVSVLPDVSCISCPIGLRRIAQRASAMSYSSALVLDRPLASRYICAHGPPSPLLSPAAVLDRVLGYSFAPPRHLNICSYGFSRWPAAPAPRCLPWVSRYVYRREGRRDGSGEAP